MINVSFLIFIIDPFRSYYFLPLLFVLFRFNLFAQILALLFSCCILTYLLTLKFCDLVSQSKFCLTVCLFFRFLITKVFGSFLLVFYLLSIDFLPYIMICNIWVIFVIIVNCQRILFYVMLLPSCHLGVPLSGAWTSLPLSLSLHACASLFMTAHFKLMVKLHIILCFLVFLLSYYLGQLKQGKNNLYFHKAIVKK